MVGPLTQAASTAPLPSPSWPALVGCATPHPTQPQDSRMPLAEAQKPAPWAEEDMGRGPGLGYGALAGMPW